MTEKKDEVQLEELKVYSLPTLGLRLGRDERRRLTRVNVYEHEDTHRKVILAEFRVEGGLELYGYRIADNKRAVKVTLPGRMLNQVRANLHEVGFDTVLVEVPKPHTWFEDRFDDRSMGPGIFNPNSDDDEELDD